jgi:hypothetical protein
MQIAEDPDFRGGESARLVVEFPIAFSLRIGELFEVLVV